ncbi:MAG: YkvA family protein [Cyanobacteria bacterium P01_D01_bin.71]
MNNLVQSFYNWYKQTIRHPQYRWILIVATLVYLISPIDIAPDFIPIIGWIDDAAIATLLAAELSQVFLETMSKRSRSAKTRRSAPHDVDFRTIDIES